MLVALKHHVLEQMREPTAPIGIILGSDVVPNLHCDRWTGMKLQSSKSVIRFVRWHAETTSKEAWGIERYPPWRPRAHR